MKRFISSLLLILLVVGCSVQKRHYMKGYYVKHHTKVESNQLAKAKIKSEEVKTENIEIEKVNQVLQTEEKVEELASINSEILINSNKPLLILDECGDLITLKNGDEIKAKVIEVTLNEIKYKKCDNLDGPIYTVAKKDVFSIKYANGTKDIIKEEVNTQPKTSTSTADEKKIHWGALVGLICSLIGISLLGIIFAFIGLNTIKEYPNKYKGTGLAHLAIIIGVLWLLILAFILLVP
jgi:hypothetical protein